MKDNNICGGGGRLGMVMPCTPIRMIKQYILSRNQILDRTPTAMITCSCRMRGGSPYLKCNIEHHADISDLRAGEVFKYRDEIEEFIVMSIREPAADRYRMLRVEDVRGRGVVDDDGFSQVTANLREIFDIVALVVVATISEKTMVDHIVDI